MDTDTITFEYCQRIGGGWTMPGIECRVRVPSYIRGDWEVEVYAYRTRPDGVTEATWKNIDKSDETAVQELRWGIVWHVEENMREQITQCVKAFDAGEEERQRANSRSAA